MRTPQACPLCASPNACAVAAGGPMDGPCWCQSQVFSEALLARIPSDRRGKACICRGCAQSVAQPIQSETEVDPT